MRSRLNLILRLLATVPLDLIVRTSPSVVSELPGNGGLLSILVLLPRCSAAAVTGFDAILKLPCVAGLPDNGEVAGLLVLFFLLNVTSPVSAAFLFCAPVFIAALSAFCISRTAFSAVSISVPNCSCTRCTKAAVAASVWFAPLPRSRFVILRHAATMPCAAVNRNASFAAASHYLVS